MHSFFKGMDFCNENELANNLDMEAKGFEITNVKGKSCEGFSNYTAYFTKKGLPVYAECYFERYELYTKLIIERDIFEKFDLKNKVIVLNTGKGDGKRCVPSISMNGTTVALHRLLGIKEDNDHQFMTLCLVTRENIRAASKLLNNKNKEKVDPIKALSTGEFKVNFSENSSLLTNEDIRTLKQMGYSFKIGKEIKINKCFQTMKEALIAIKEYEDIFYKGYAYTVINDMRSRFDLSYQQLILRTMTKDDVIKLILKDYANDAYSVYRYNLIPLFDKYGIPFNKGITLPNGDLVNL